MMMTLYIWCFQKVNSMEHDFELIFKTVVKTHFIKKKNYCRKGKK